MAKKNNLKKDKNSSKRSLIKEPLVAFSLGLNIVFIFFAVSFAVIYYGGSANLGHKLINMGMTSCFKADYFKTDINTPEKTVSFNGNKVDVVRVPDSLRQNHCMSSLAFNSALSYALTNPNEVAQDFKTSNLNYFVFVGKDGKPVQSEFIKTTVFDLSPLF